MSRHVKTPTSTMDDVVEKFRLIIASKALIFNNAATDVMAWLRLIPVDSAIILSCVFLAITAVASITVCLLRRRRLAKAEVRDVRKILEGWIGHIAKTTQATDPEFLD